MVSISTKILNNFFAMLFDVLNSAQYLQDMEGKL